MEIEFGKVEEEWNEPMGPTPSPRVTELRDWDFKLLERHPPLYSPLCDMCCFCTYGKCDLTQGKTGACGIDIKTQQARMIAMEVAMGAACHEAHARHILHKAMEKAGRDAKIDFGLNVAIEAPVMRTIMGVKPRTLADLEQALDYAEEQISVVLSAVNTGQEGDYRDLESKALHAGMIDNLVKEVTDIAQIIGYDFPKGDPNAPLVEIGLGTVDKGKPVILCIGHDAAPSIEILNYLDAKNLRDEVQVCGICCTAHDLARRSDKVKVIGPYTQQMKFVKTGVADVIVIDEQCVRTDIHKIAQQLRTPIIATNERNCHGLRDRTKDEVNEVIDDLVSGREPGALILDDEKVGIVASEVARRIAPLRAHIRAVPSEEELIAQAKRCTSCEACYRVCPANIHISKAMAAAAKGNLELLADCRDRCIGCIKCEPACKKEIPIVNMFHKAADRRIKEEKFKLRAGRGPILDTEIRHVGPPIVLGEIPGVVAFAGCTNHPNGGKEVAQMAEEFLKRRYIVVASGCAAMDIATYKNEEGKSLYEAYPGDFDAGCLTNVGSCVANAHILGAAIKIPHLFARRNLRANFEEIADYIYNRVGAVGVVWGTMSQKALAIETGCNRWGVPILLGPHGSKYRRLLVGRKDKAESWRVYDAKTGSEMLVDPAPEHLAYVAESKEEAMVLIPKLCIRPNDTTKGRQIKLAHYIDLYEKIYGTMPPDLHLFVRTKGDIPVTRKDEVLKMLEQRKDWKERATPDPTLVKRLAKPPVATAPRGGAC